MKSGYLSDVVFPVGKAVISIGVPIALGYLAYSMSPQFQKCSVDQKLAFTHERDECERVVTASFIPVAIVATSLLYFFGSKR